MRGGGEGIDIICRSVLSLEVLEFDVQYPRVALS